MITSDQIDKIATALAAAQGEMDAAKKRAVNPFFSSKFADLASVKDAIREPFETHGLSYVQFPTTTFAGTPEPYEWTDRGGELRGGVHVLCTVSIVTRLMHTSGQWIQGDPVSALLPSGDPQPVGSAISYLKRYALQAVSGVASEDDDAEAAQGRGSDPAKAGHDESATGRHAAAPRDTRPLPSAPIEMHHPDGYLDWLDTLRTVAMEGTGALHRAWNASTGANQKHLLTHGADLWATLRAIAARKVA